MSINLRPQTFNEFVGQKRLKATLEVLIKAAQMQNKQLDHLLFCGPPGRGKTSLVNIIGKYYQRNIKFAQGLLLEKPAHLLTLFSNLKNGEIIFIDEIHSVNKQLFELIFIALEDNKLDIVIGPEGEKRIMRLTLPPFTLIGATTKRHLLPLPLLNRFGLIAQLTDYHDHEIEEIIINNVQKMNLVLKPEAIKMIANYSKNNPRIANNLLKRVGDFAIVQNQKSVDKNLVFTVFKALGLYPLGLNERHLEYLKILHLTFKNKAIALETLAGILQESRAFIEQEIEIDLLKNNLIFKNSQGRKITEKGISYLSQIILV